MSSATAVRFLRAFDRQRLSVLAVLVAISCCPIVCLAQSQSQRNSFPGRRIGGATRGECSSRLLAHLVPESSVYAPGKTSHLGVLEGPTANTVPLEVAFRLRPMEGSRSNEKGNENVLIIELPRSTAGITLIKLGSLQFPTVWESSYQCGDTDVVSRDPLAFVQTASPPAMSLLIRDSAQSADLSNQQALDQLVTQCDGTVQTEDFAKAFGFDDVIDSSWPTELPVRCPD